MTLRFYQDVPDEVLTTLPSMSIHIGGDEAVKDQGVASPRIQQRIQVLGLKDEHELQAHFNGRMDEYRTACGPRLIGWDEVLEVPEVRLAPGATVVNRRGSDGGITAARLGHDVVMAVRTSPTSTTTRPTTKPTRNSLRPTACSRSEKPTPTTPSRPN